ncbi:hypothetical protein TraAM80_02791 [Trypanosoma rangeli]|uniref:Uncharacterized protein n=1 Tax=Trypanosoma rangeli TaxID=5698 RepID=A0A3R7NLM7_TRYRA|nr:uncharacterized protein TraAM80_02791 [Trypanosoma rangeli]RNF08285.1 hypothetical protein TraAM80_02791 [Trypanosoma rangeli]|eukprot:RNF08285.1 hypothetical protein TraAM80_02791 [Trypanosoma rangeli]
MLILLDALSPCPVASKDSSMASVSDTINSRRATNRCVAIFSHPSSISLFRRRRFGKCLIGALNKPANAARVEVVVLSLDRSMKRAETLIHRGGIGRLIHKGDDGVRHG